MAELFLVRHGQASFGTDDYDRLSAAGDQQGVWLGEYFARQGLAFDRVICGTMNRHAQTVAAILRGMGREGVAVDRHPGLNEYDFHGLFAAAASDYPEIARLAAGSMKEHFRALRQVLQLWTEDKLGDAAPETWAHFQQRVADARAVIRHGGGQRVLVVSSGGPIAVTVQQVLAAPPSSAIALNLQIRNSSLSQFFFNAEAFHLASFNGIPHLEDPERHALRTYG
ncbi:histidine phosphatase family protein [Burkholderia cenocepacia]|uniref:histidine phosphatase family protein n=1 Tax=Burkholderia cenocepacia TaxID=95486 RepID=UPI00209F4F5C|nr:histidine phosphatase family protein [Burkholderia cenocepacia]MCO8325530.1 phosphoglycerate mutase family protein [Burkholderia cenocepacia]MCO8332600.1 phosphoglycerate mutase family protein [Burkholderia cenocepacia]MCO8340100.1 phosphoglycerate mutase family protein [Burkholderia cenocepacia]MCO8347386.1 phosphoglycerate mutase family protein [Burkholderia cenocepacia]MCO8360452.1 phosphoglycerate mutase family protein [Burkholderia cenocepacia]